MGFVPRRRTGRPNIPRSRKFGARRAPGRQFSKMMRISEDTGEACGLLFVSHSFSPETETSLRRSLDAVRSRMSHPLTAIHSSLASGSYSYSLYCHRISSRNKDAAHPRYKSSLLPFTCTLHSVHFRFVEKYLSSVCSVLSSAPP